MHTTPFINYFFFGGTVLYILLLVLAPVVAGIALIRHFATKPKAPPLPYRWKDDNLMVLGWDRDKVLWGSCTFTGTVRNLTAMTLYSATVVLKSPLSEGCVLLKFHPIAPYATVTASSIASEELNTLSSYAVSNVSYNLAAPSNQISAVAKSALRRIPALGSTDADRLRRWA